MSTPKTGNCRSCGIAVSGRKEFCDGCSLKSGISLKSERGDGGRGGCDRCGGDRDRNGDCGCGGGGHRPFPGPSPAPVGSTFLAASYSTTGASSSAGLPLIPFVGTGVSTAIAVPVFNVSSSANNLSSPPTSPFFTQSTLALPNPTTEIITIPKKGAYRVSLKFSANSGNVAVPTTFTTNSVTFTVTRAGSVVFTGTTNNTVVATQPTLNYEDNRILLLEAGDQLSWNYLFTTAPVPAPAWTVTDYALAINSV
jgi:hypothetical protein